MIWALVVLLALVSLLAVYSATGSLAYKNYKGNTEVYLFKQIAFIVVGILVIYFAHLVNYTLYSRVATIMFLLVIPLLIYTLFFGVRMNEGSRWIRLTTDQHDNANFRSGKACIVHVPGEIIK